jgi:putative tricarboxylic transport membrane protein
MVDQLSYMWIGLMNTFDPLNFLMILVGLIIGVLAGALPGITMLNAIVLVLPFTYLMGIVPSLLLMSGIYCGGVFGGSITGILFNIPGDPMNVPTTWEGYKLNKKGFVSKALGMAIMCSAIGGFISAVLMTLAGPPFAKVALSFSSTEYFAVVFLGLASVVVIGTRSMGSALISMFIGLILATVGMDDIYGAPRFTFGIRIMETGINFVTVLIGIFAIGEVLEQLSLRNKGEGEIYHVRPKTSLPTFGELWALRNSLLRGLGIGTAMGALPGSGATVTSFVSYGVEKQVSKHPERFGTGVWEGLVASETSINASTGGAMLHLFALGIPGSGATAVMMGAFLLHGIQPGPMLFTKTPEEVYTIFVGFMVCNLVMILAGLACAKFFSELMRVPEIILSAFIISFCLLGAFALRNDMTDVWFMVIFGIVGYFMRRYDLPTPPMILGLILGPMAEKYFITSMIGEANDVTIFFRRPVSGVLMVASIGILLMPVLRNLRKRGKKVKEGA